MSEIVNMNEAGIDEEKDYIEDEEMIVRLLSSPKLYDTDTCRLNADELKYYLVILELCERLEPFVILKKQD
ncbi:hypothetical protein [Prevotella sp.]|jgi:hypothetical protein|uniref:hypothetical protein n=2 Tax=Prevotella sp. TaxID=59823 RepID=UPI003AB145F9